MPKNQKIIANEEVREREKSIEGGRVRVVFNSYRQTMGDSPLIPKKTDQLKALMYAFLLYKAVYEVNYELNNRPSWVKLPLQGILEILEQG